MPKTTIEIRNEKRKQLYKILEGLNMFEIETLFEQVLDGVKFDAIYNPTKKKKDE